MHAAAARSDFDGIESATHGRLIKRIRPQVRA